MKYTESASVELKNDLTEAVKNEIIAFLNTKGGMIYVGVEDDGRVNQDFLTKNRDEQDTRLSNWIQDVFFPNPSSLIEYGFNDDGVMEIRIKEGDQKPYYLVDKGSRPTGVYKRVGSSVRKANSDEILSMLMQSRNYVYENDISDEQELTFRQLEKIFEDNGLSLTERAMVNFGILNENKEFTNLGRLVSDQSDVVVKVAEYDSRMNFRIKKTFSGSPSG